MNQIIEILRARGLIENITCEKFPEGSLRVYSGIDPSADCLHLGNLLALVVLRWFQLCGHTPVVILGGATGMIGDPSGRSKERNLLDIHSVQSNVRSIEKIVRKLLPAQEGMPAPLFYNNFDWFKDFNFIEFLRDVGKHFRMGTMLAKESVQARLNSDEGVSFTEFCYQTLQAYDFFHLFEHHGITIQCGGSDQWGNILAGCDLIGRKSNSLQKPFGIVWPLLLRSDGRKFGKSEEGAVWLSEEKLSAYKFYQYALNTPDSDVIGFMKKLTFMPLEEIDAYERGIRDQTDPPNTAQRKYALELTRFIHGEQGLAKALETTEVANPGKLLQLDGEKLEAVSSQVPTCTLSYEDVVGHKIIDVMVLSGIVESKAAARRLIENRGAYLNQAVIDDTQGALGDDNLIDGKWLVLSAGKKKRLLVRLKRAPH